MLKALELAGFKSFADKTRFEFHRGITVVVGPNGSGKSNVVDAIKWVLGSQSPKSLRGSEMTDVIFNGSGSRSGLNTAEVTLILDNREKHYPSDADEVALTRRVYRSGEGEYLINGSVCRLKDIRELLAGTGIGTEAYSIIEQGKVDALLQASPRDRRAIFEEAAGISRFRAKRQEAGRRLARVEQNLLRLSDIVDEVESRLRSVRQQAGKAQRYRDATRRLKELRTELGVADWWQIADRLAALEAEQQQFSQEDEAHRTRAEEAERQLPQLEVAIDQGEQELRELDAKLADFRQQQVASRATAEGLAERRSDLVASLNHLEQQWQECRTPADDSQRLAADATAQLDALETELQLTTASGLAATEREAQLAQQLEHARRRLADLRDRLAAAGQQLALLDQRLFLADEQLATEQARADDLALQLEGVEAALEESREQVSRLTRQEEEAARVAQAAAEKLRQAQQQLTQTQQRLSQLTRELQTQERELAALEHRREMVSQLDQERRQQQEAIGQFIDGVFGPAPTLAELLHVDVDTASLVEAALGGLAEHVVVSTLRPMLGSQYTPDEVPQGTQLLEASFTPAPTALDHVDLSRLPGVWGRADQFVEVAPAYAPLLRRLLGRTWIVDTLETAHHLAGSQGQGLNFVTADGQLLTAEGALRFPARQGGLTRRHHTEQLSDEVARLAPQVAQLRAKVETSEGEQTGLAQRAQQALEQQTAATTELAELRQQLATATATTTHHAAQREQLAARAEGIQTRVAELQAERATHEQQLFSLRAERRQLALACDKIAHHEAILQIEWEEVRDTQQSTRLMVARLEQQVEALRDQVAQTRHAEREDQRQQQLTRQIEELRARILEIERQQLTATSAEAEATSSHDQLLPARQACLANLEECRRRRQPLQQALQQARRSLDATQSRRNQLEVAIAKLQHQRQTLVTRLLEEYDIDLPALAHQRPAETASLDRKQVEREIDELRATLQKIGAVNVDALEELDQIEARYEAISGQYRDLSQAKAGLQRLMTRLNTESRQLFLATVETVRGHFQELFRRLFGGGEADIVLELEEGEDAMECGVEIRACPPGKETCNISLLSGGEKTMTCVALLLAMFRSKPSPFCVLDEVDAALDEANVGRFTSVLHDFLSATQFLVVTHSKKTMTGADTLYGVTMQEGGISKQVSVRFEDVTDDGFIRPSAMLRGEGGKRAA